MEKNNPGTKIKSFLLWFLVVECGLLFLSNGSLNAQHLQPMLSREQLNRAISSLFQPERQRLRSADALFPPAFRKCGTPLIRQALRHRELLDPENRFILHRPTDPPTDPRDPYYDTDAIWHYDSPGGHFRLYYTEDRFSADRVEGADEQQSTIPEYVKKLASYFDDAWEYQTVTLGYQAPSGQNAVVEVFILYIADYGITASDKDGLYIMVRNNYRNIGENMDEDNEAGAMKVTAVHEFFHVVQDVYDHWTSPLIYVDNTWWEENTAVWIEDEKYDQVDDYLNYLGWPYRDINDNGRWDKGEVFSVFGAPLEYGYRDKKWFDYPYMALDKTSFDFPRDYPLYTYFEYGGVIWAKFLSENFGQGVVKSIFEQIPHSSYDALSAISQILQQDNNTSFDDAFIHFKLANLLRDYEEGDNYPLPFHEQPGFGVSSNSLDPLSCRYLSFAKPDSGTISICFDGADSAKWALWAVPASSYNVLPGSSPQFGQSRAIFLDANQDGSYQFDFGDTNYSKLVIIPINLSWQTDASYRLNVQAQPLVDKCDFPLAPTDNKHTDTNGLCFINTLAVIVLSR